MKIPFLDLRRQYQQIKSEIDQALQEVISSQMFILGDAVSEFEKKLALYCGTNYAVGCSSGTDALILSLLSAGIKEGDEVITTPFTFFATAEAIIRVGAKPIFVDIDEKTYNINTSEIEKNISQATKAIIPVHIFGQCSNMDEIIKISDDYNLVVIEDAAQAIGAEWNGKKAGSMGDFGCFSFFPAKNLGCFGDGGAVVTNSEESYRKLISLRQHGLNPDIRYDHMYLGGNFRLDAIQAAVLSVKLKYIDKWNDARRRNAELYASSLRESRLILPRSDERARHVYNQYTIRAKDRDTVRDNLSKLGVPTACYYPFPMSNRTAIPIEYRNDSLNTCNKVCTEVFSIPVFPDLTKDELSYISRSVLESIE